MMHTCRQHCSQY